MLAGGGAETEVEEMVERREGEPVLGTETLERCSDSISVAKEFLLIFLSPACPSWHQASYPATFVQGELSACHHCTAQ